MNWRLAGWSALGTAAVLATIGAAWIFTLPAAPAPKAPPLVAKAEADATIAALKPPKRQRRRSIGPGAARNRDALPNAHRRLRRHARIPPVQRAELKRAWHKKVKSQ